MKNITSFWRLNTSQIVPNLQKAAPDSFFTNAWMHAFKHVAETELAEQYARGTRAWSNKSTQEYIWQFSAAQTRRATAICGSAVALVFG